MPSIRLRLARHARSASGADQAQVALITPLIHVKGYAALETKAVIERARLLIEQAQARGEPPEDPLILFSTLYGFLTMNVVAFNGDVLRRLAAEFLALAEKQETMPLSLPRQRSRLALCWLRIALWASVCCFWETFQKASHTLNGRLSCTIRQNIVH